MHLSLLLLIASFQTTGQTQNPSVKQANAAQDSSSPLIESDQKPELPASRIPHFRSALKTPSQQATQSPVAQSPSANSFVPPPTQPFSPIRNSNQAQTANPAKQSISESAGFNPVNPSATSPLRTKTSTTTESNTPSGAFLKNSPNQTNSSTPPSSILPSTGQPNSTQINPGQPAVTRSPVFSPTTPVSKNAVSNPPATDAQQLSVPKDSSMPLTQPSGSFSNQGNTFGTGSNLRQTSSINGNPNNPPNSVPNGSISSNANANDAVNPTPTIQPRGVTGGITQPERGMAIQDSVRQPSQTQTLQAQTQNLDTTYDPKLKNLAESILRSNPRGEKNRVGLADVVQTARNTSQRRQIVREYWTGFVNQADADFAAQERSILQQLSQPNNRFEQVLIRAAIRSSEARLAEANLEMAKSNSKIYSYLPSLAKGQELVFADLPWVGKYKTNANQLAATGRFTSKILNVDKALIGVRDLIQLRAASVYENMTALQQAISEYQNGRVRLSVVVMLNKEVRDQRIAFLTSVRDYNIAIADYAITAYPNAVDPQLVAGMLVDTKKTLPKIDLVADRQIRQASGIQNLSPGKNGYRGTADPEVRQAGGF